MEITQEEIIRFNDSYVQEGKCKLWKRYLDKDGYGFFYFRKKTRKAHRVAYFIANGAIPDGMVIDHLCKNRNCVAIEHLRCVTKGQNTLENSSSLGAMNKMKQFCKLGHRFDKVYGTKKKQRYCSICENAKSKRLQKKWLKEARLIKC
jgi:mRNA deadenylase 3'-5' endonuclease subunit Ccr4